jgi:hypothetical protein
MPRASYKYQFEWKILEWAWKLSWAFCGGSHYPFVILFGASGVADRLVFGPAPETHDENEWKRLLERAPAWLAFDPFEGPEYQYLSWEGLERQTVERLIGITFGPEDFGSEEGTIAFPTKWGVMF